MAHLHERALYILSRRLGCRSLLLQICLHDMGVFQTYGMENTPYPGPVALRVVHRVGHM